MNKIMIGLLFALLAIGSPSTEARTQKKSRKKAPKEFPFYTVVFAITGTIMGSYGLYKGYEWLAGEDTNLGKRIDAIKHLILKNDIKSEEEFNKQLGKIFLDDLIKHSEEKVFGMKEYVKTQMGEPSLREEEKKKIKAVFNKKIAEYEDHIKDLKKKP